MRKKKLPVDAPAPERVLLTDRNPSLGQVSFLRAASHSEVQIGGQCRSNESRTTRAKRLGKVRVTCTDKSYGCLGVLFFYRFVFFFLISFLSIAAATKKLLLPSRHYNCLDRLATDLGLVVDDRLVTRSLITIQYMDLCFRRVEAAADRTRLDVS